MNKFATIVKRLKALLTLHEECNLKDEDKLACDLYEDIERLVEELTIN